MSSSAARGPREPPEPAPEAVYNAAVALLPPRLLVALDADGIRAAVVQRGIQRPRVSALSWCPLDPGALAPSPVDANVVRFEEVRAALERVAREIGVNGRLVTCALPDGTARAAVFPSPRGVGAEEFVRFRLGSSLPYPSSEAVARLLPAGRGRVLAAAVRRGVVEGYEAVLEAAGMRRDRIDVMSLAALRALRVRLRGRGAVVAVVSGAWSTTLAFLESGALRVFRSRRMQAGAREVEWIAEEIHRTAILATGRTAGEVFVAGADSASLSHELCARGLRVTPEGVAPDLATQPWLAAALS
jgi:Tfp pilus assembly PilM family ATPase